MEAIINSSVIGFVVLIALIVEIFMYRTQPSQQRIADYQKDLDEKAANAKARHNIDLKHDALTEIMKERKLIKGFTLIFSGIFLALVWIALIFFVPSFREIIIPICACILLMCYGLFRIAESKTTAIIVLSTGFILSAGCLYLFDKAMELSVYSFLYLCGFIVVVSGPLAIIQIIKQQRLKKFTLKNGL